MTNIDHQNRLTTTSHETSLTEPNAQVSFLEGMPPHETEIETLQNHLIIIHQTPDVVHVNEQFDDYIRGSHVHAGAINIISAGALSFCHWDRPLTFTRLDISPTFLNETAQQLELPQPHIELHHAIHTHDPHILQVSQWMVNELQNSQVGGQLYADSLTNALAVHLLRNYTNGVSTDPPLAQREVGQAIAYMQAHLASDISLADLAQAANLSASHLRRLFKRTTGIPPHQYLIQLRVERAQQLLQTGRHTISDVAIQVGFTDQSHLHRHFKRIHGVTPKAMLP